MMPVKLTELSPAKINLFLKIINKRKDGYHNIRSGITLINLFDHLSHIIGNNSSSEPYVTTQWRTIRIIRAVILHYVFGWNWEKIGKKYGLKTMCDHIHLNENGGIILENLIKEFLD